MGNCIAHDPQLHWAGEDWGPALAPPEPAQTGSRCDPVVFTEVKVKITKKHLEELIQKLDAQAGLTAQQVVSQFIRASSSSGYQTTTNWRPSLQSIPELASSDSSGSASLIH